MIKGGPISRIINFIEPALISKRQGIINKRFGKPEITPSQIQEQLQELRKREVKAIKKNLTHLKKLVTRNKYLSLQIVSTPKEVVDYIITQDKKLKLCTIAINRSNTVRALEPDLIKNGFEIIRTYNNTVASGTLGVFDTINRNSESKKEMEPGQYWTLQNFELENSYSSFDINNRPMTYPKEILISTRSSSKVDQEFIGLIGANVFSANGDIFEVQHLYNISSILAHAKHTFIVLTLDKLVNSFTDAFYQARCTAMYGLEQIILDLFDSEREDRITKKTDPKKSKKSFAKLSLKDDYDKFIQPKELSIIILDDKRTDLLGSKSEDILYCIGCRRCGLHCPRIRTSEPGVPKRTAHELLMDGMLFGPERAIEDGLFNCTLCRSCSNICPVGIDLAEHLQKLRERCQNEDLFAEPHKRIKNNIAETGNAYGSENTYKLRGRNKNE